jgi:hypothetical protein
MDGLKASVELESNTAEAKRRDFMVASSLFWIFGVDQEWIKSQKRVMALWDGFVRSH